MSYSEMNYFETQWGVLPCSAAADPAAPQAVLWFKTLLTLSEMCSKMTKGWGADARAADLSREASAQKDHQLYFSFLLIHWWGCLEKQRLVETCGFSIGKFRFVFQKFFIILTQCQNVLVKQHLYHLIMNTNDISHKNDPFPQKPVRKLM